jgi:hypothetical protein
VANRNAGLHWSFSHDQVRFEFGKPIRTLAFEAADGGFDGQCGRAGHVLARWYGRVGDLSSALGVSRATAYQRSLCTPLKPFMSGTTFTVIGRPLPRSTGGKALPERMFAHCHHFRGS